MNRQEFFEKFGELADFEGGVQALRDRILMLMIQGKLVGHDPNDESASELLDRIRQKRKQTDNKNSAAEHESVPAVNPEEMPFKLPRNWAWSRWGDFIDELSTLESPEKTAQTLRTGDFIVTRNSETGNVGRSLIVTEKAGYEELGKEFIQLKMSAEIDARFVDLTNNSPAGRMYYQSESLEKDDARHIAPSAITHMPFPIPPRAEQERIVREVEKLMDYCAELEAEYSQRNTDRQRTLQAVVDQCFG